MRVVAPGVSCDADPIVRYRNRDIRESDLVFIRGVFLQHVGSPRCKVVAEICRAWAWRQASGPFSLSACDDLLLRLAEWGYIELPKRKTGSSRRRTYPLLPADLIPLAWVKLPQNVSLTTLIVRPITSDELLGWRVFMQRYHYLGFRMLIGERLLYAAFIEGELVALVGWASAALRAPLRDKFIGWDEMTKRSRLHLVANNTRFLVFPWVRKKNLASKILAQNLRRLSVDWQTQWNHPVYLAETFVDTARFAGTCYRASNWKYLGQTAGRTKQGNAYLSVGTPKSLYIYELHKKARHYLRDGGEC